MSSSSRPAPRRHGPGASTRRAEKGRERGATRSTGCCSFGPHVTQCPYCIRGHTRAALRAGATREEIIEAIWVAAEMRAGAAYAHSALALDAMDELDKRSAG